MPARNPGNSHDWHDSSRHAPVCCKTQRDIHIRLSLGVLALFSLTACEDALTQHLNATLAAQDARDKYFECRHERYCSPEEEERLRSIIREKEAEADQLGPEASAIYRSELEAVQSSSYDQTYSPPQVIIPSGGYNNSAYDDPMRQVEQNRMDMEASAARERLQDAIRAISDSGPRECVDLACGYEDPGKQQQCLADMARINAGCIGR